jgi:hypothetical protein
LPRTKYKVFRIAILHDGSVYNWLHLCIFDEFFKALKFEFFLGLNKELHGAHVPKRRTPWPTIILDWEVL